MRRFLSIAPALALLFTLCGAASGQDLPTTTEHGITIGPDELVAAIQESQDFWGPVRTYLVSPDCTALTQVEREQAVAFLKRIHEGLQQRLFDRTEADAIDLVNYLSHRLRMFEVYRGLRAAIADDALTVGMIQEWEKAFREIHTHPVDQRAPKISALVTRMEGRMQAAGLEAAKVAAAQKLWVVQADVVEKMSTTGAGQMMIDFEILGCTEVTIPVGQFLLDVSSAADWVVITREPATTIGREHFVKAYSELAELRTKYASVTSGTTTR